MMSRGSIAVGVGVTAALELQALTTRVKAIKIKTLPTTDLLLE